MVKTYRSIVNWRLDYTVRWRLNHTVRWWLNDTTVNVVRWYNDVEEWWCVVVHNHRNSTYVIHTVQLLYVLYDSNMAYYFQQKRASIDSFHWIICVLIYMTVLNGNNEMTNYGIRYEISKFKFRWQHPHWLSDHIFINLFNSSYIPWVQFFSPNNSPQFSPFTFLYCMPYFIVFFFL